MPKRVQKTTRRRRKPIPVREAFEAARRFATINEEWYPDPFVPEHGAAVAKICAEKRKHRSSKVAKKKRAVPQYICGGAGGKNWQRRSEAVTVVRDNAMRWEGNLRSQLQISLKLDIDVFTCNVAHLRQLQVSNRPKLTNEQSRFIDMIAHLSEIREALDSFFKAANRIDDKQGRAEIVKEEGAVLAARLISHSMSLAGMAGEVVMDEEVTKRKHSVTVNRENATKKRKLTPERAVEAVARMDELFHSTDLVTTAAAKQVAEELTEKYSVPIGQGTIYNAYKRACRSRDLKPFFIRLLAGSEGVNDKVDISTCQLLAMSPLEMALWHFVRHGRHSSTE